MGVSNPFRPLLERLTQALAKAPHIPPSSIQAEAERILEASYERITGHVLSRTDLLMPTELPLPGEVEPLALRVAQRRVEGLPLQYLLGFQVFHGHRYRVGPGVLIPRPETELLVELVQAWWKEHKRTPALGIEIGLGSGAISIELLHHFKGLEMWATEISPEAQDYALSNAAYILGEEPGGMHRLQVFESEDPVHVFQSLHKRALRFHADFLVSNPPYLDEEDEISDDVRKHEPAQALFPANHDPLYFYQVIAQEAAQYINAGAPLFLEISSDRSAETVALFERNGWNVSLKPDLTGRHRFIIATKDPKENSHG